MQTLNRFIRTVTAIRSQITDKTRREGVRNSVASKFNAPLADLTNHDSDPNNLLNVAVENVFRKTDWQSSGLEDTEKRINCVILDLKMYSDSGAVPLVFFYPRRLTIFTFPSVTYYGKQKSLPISMITVLWSETILVNFHWTSWTVRWRFEYSNTLVWTFVSPCGSIKCATKTEIESLYAAIVAKSSSLLL